MLGAATSFPSAFFISDKTLMKQSHGKAISDHLQAANREIALPFEACVLFLQHFGLKEKVIVGLLHTEFSF